MKKVLIAVTLALAISIGAYLLLGADPAPAPVHAVVEGPLVAEPLDSAPLPIPAEVFPEPVAVTRQSAAGDTSALPAPRTLANPPAGYVKVTQSLDFNRYLEFMSIAGYVEGNAHDLLALQVQQYGLTDEEREALVDYSVSALNADRDFQKRSGRRICSRRTEYQSFHDFGTALNELVSETKQNQEHLGREAELTLGVELFNKINNQVLRKPPQEPLVADFSSIFARRSTDLATEIDRFCSAESLKD